MPTIFVSEETKESFDGVQRLLNYRTGMNLNQDQVLKHLLKKFSEPEGLDPDPTKEDNK